MVRPVSIDVATHTTGGCCVLTILTPHSVGRLRESKAIGVHDGEYVKVISVLEGLRFLIGRGEELECSIFHNLSLISLEPHKLRMLLAYHRRDPFSRVNSAVPHHSWFGVVLASVDMDSYDISPLGGFTGGDDLGVVGI